MFNSIEEADFVRTELQQNGISAYIGYVPLHSSSVGLNMGNKKNDLPLTEEFSQRILRLPLHNNMTKDLSVEIANMTVELIKEFRS